MNQLSLGARIGGVCVLLMVLPFMLHCSESSAQENENTVVSTTGFGTGPQAGPGHGTKNNVPAAAGVGAPQVAPGKADLVVIEWGKEFVIEISKYQDDEHVRGVKWVNVAVVQAFREVSGDNVRVAAKFALGQKTRTAAGVEQDAGVNTNFYPSDSDLRALNALVAQLVVARFDARPNVISDRLAQMNWYETVLQKTDAGYRLWDPDLAFNFPRWRAFEPVLFRKAVDKAIEEIDNLSKTPMSIHPGK